MAPAHPDAGSKTALLIMDFQNDIVKGIPETVRGAVLDNAAALLERARKIGMPVFFVIVKFRPGHPEINTRNKGFAALKAANRLIDGTPGAQIHERVQPMDDEPVVIKRRTSGFYNTELEALLSARGVDNVVMAGLFTSGVVLSSLRWAADRDYGIAVASDACADADMDVHRVLVDKIFVRQANVATTAALLESPDFS